MQDFLLCAAHLCLLLPVKPYTGLIFKVGYNQVKKAVCDGGNRRIEGRWEAESYFQILLSEREGQFHCIQSGSKCHVLGHRETALKRKRPEQEKKLLMLGTPGPRGPESSHTRAQEGLGPGGSISLLHRPRPVARRCLEWWCWWEWLNPR